MNLSKFKIASQDDNTYTVKHPSGRSFTVDKAGLSKEAHKHIQKLAGGGLVDSSPTDESIVQQLAAQPTQDVPPTPDEPGILTKIGAAIDPNSTDAQTVSDYDQSQQVKGPAPASVEQPAQAVPQPTAPNPLAQAATSQGQLLSQEEQQAKQYQAGVAGANAPVNTAINQAQQQLADNAKNADAIAYSRGIDDDKYAEKLKSQNIDPNRVYKNMDTGSKILSGIAMILGGAGSGVAGGPNLAAKAMDDAVNRDIDAQKNDKENTMNLWKMNRQAYGDDMQANLATRNQILTGVQLQMQKAAATTTNMDAKMRADQFLNQIQGEKIQNNKMQGLLSTQAPGGQTGTLGVDPAYLLNSIQDPKQKEAATAEVSRAQNVSKNSKEILQAFDDATNENTVARTGAGLLRTPGSVMALHQLILPNFKNIDGTVRQAAMDETFHNVTPQPGDSQHKIDQKRQALNEWMNSETTNAPNFKAGTGVDLTKFASAAPQQSAPVQRITKDGRTALFNPETKQFLGYK